MFQGWRAKQLRLWMVTMHTLTTTEMWCKSWPPKSNTTMVNFLLQREEKLHPPELLACGKDKTPSPTQQKVLRVHYSGESGIDSGAIALELLERCIPDMAQSMFPDGAPLESSFLVQKKLAVFGHVEKLLHCHLLREDHPPVFSNGVAMSQQLKKLT